MLHENDEVRILLGDILRGSSRRREEGEGYSDVNKTAEITQLQI